MMTTNEQQLIDALLPFAFAFTETRPTGAIPDESIWIWKPSSNKRETHGISRAHLRAAANALSNAGIDWKKDKHE